MERRDCQDILDNLAALATLESLGLPDQLETLVPLALVLDLLDPLAHLEMLGDQGSKEQRVSLDPLVERVVLVTPVMLGDLDLMAQEDLQVQRENLASLVSTEFRVNLVPLVVLVPRDSKVTMDHVESLDPRGQRVNRV